MKHLSTKFKNAVVRNNFGLAVRKIATTAWVVEKDIPLAAEHLEYLLNHHSIEFIENTLKADETLVKNEDALFQRILTEVEAKRAQIALQKVHARKYIGVSTKNLGSYIAQHHKTHISTYDSAEKAALAHDIFCRSLRLCSRMNDTINEGNTKLSVDEKDELHKKIEKVKKKREASLKK